MGIARPGRRVVVCRDVESAQMVIENENVDAIVADIQFRGDFSFEGLDLVGVLHKEAPEKPIFLMTGAGHEGLEREAFRRGAAGFFRKPFSVEELDQALEAPADDALEEDEQRVSIPDLGELLEGNLIHASFQPIVRLDSREHIGLEALARPATETLFRSPELLFRYANRTDQTLELERHCIGYAIRAATNLQRDKLLFLNVNPASLESSAVISIIEQSTEETQFSPSRIVLEITEQGALQSSRSLEQINRLKKLGIRFALDDIGTAFSHLPFIDEIGPDWMKISQYFGTGFESDPTKSKIVKSIASLAASFDARFILEGIETEETATAARELGIEYGQGYLFARPAAIETFQYL